MRRRAAAMRVGEAREVGFEGMKRERGKGPPGAAMGGWAWM